MARGTVKIEKQDRRWKDMITLIATFTVLFSSEPTRSRFIPDFQNFTKIGDKREMLSFKNEASFQSLILYLIYIYIYISSRIHRIEIM
jgi:hypothetical protein